MLPPPEGVQSFNELPEEPFTVLPSGAAIQVSGEENHMGVLARYVSDRDRHLAVTLHVVEEAKTERSTPYTCVEVRLDGHRVGTLTKAASEKLADVIGFVTERGRVPVGRAILKGPRSVRNLSSSLQSPTRSPAPGLTEYPLRPEPPVLLVQSIRAHEERTTLDQKGFPPEFIDLMEATDPVQLTSQVVHHAAAGMTLLLWRSTRVVPDMSAG